jgi:hypothetical protein
MGFAKISLKKNYFILLFLIFVFNLFLCYYFFELFNFLYLREEYIMSLIKSIIVKIRIGENLKLGKINLSDVKKLSDCKTKEILLNIFKFDLISTEEEIEHEFSFHQQSDEGILTFPEFKSYLSTLSGENILSLTSLKSVDSHSKIKLPLNIIEEMFDLLKPINKQIEEEKFESVLLNFFDSYEAKHYELKILGEFCEE